jgi:CheY-like chemotaxis protein
MGSVCSFEDLATQVAEGVVVVDRRGRIKYLNEQAAIMLGRPHGELVGEVLDDLPADGVTAPRPLERPDGSHVEGEVVAVAVARGVRLVTLRDVSEGLRAERLRGQLAQADRLAAIGQLASAVGHEVNNILGSLLANVTLIGEHVETLQELFGELAAGRSKLAKRNAGWIDELFHDFEVGLIREELSDMTRDSLEAVRRVEMAVKNLSRRARSEQLDMAPVAFEEVIEASLRMANKEIRQRGALLVKRVDKLPQLRGDRGRLTQAVATLLLNAAQALGDDAGGSAVRLAARMTGGDVVIEVGDRPAVEADALSRGQLEDRRGFGLVREIVENHGGTLEALYDGGEAVFRMRLPAGEASAPVDPLDTPLPRARVLVVDDEQALLAVYRRVLEPSHEVVAVTSGAEAIRTIERDSAFDLVICDVMMPDMDGPSFYHRLAQRSPELVRKLVFCSGGAFTASARQFVDSIPNMCFQKPLSPDKIQRILRHALLSLPPPSA